MTRAANLTAHVTQLHAICTISTISIAPLPHGMQWKSPPGETPGTNPTFSQYKRGQGKQYQLAIQVELVPDSYG